MGEGLCGGAKAPPFQGCPVSAAQAVFRQCGGPKGHEIYAEDDSLEAFFRSLVCSPAAYGVFQGSKRVVLPNLVLISWKI